MYTRLKIYRLWNFTQHQVVPMQTQNSRHLFSSPKRMFCRQTIITKLWQTRTTMREQVKFYRHLIIQPELKTQGTVTQLINQRSIKIYKNNRLIAIFRFQIWCAWHVKVATLEPCLEIVSPRHRGWRSSSPICIFTNDKSCLNYTPSFEFLFLWNL